MAGTMSKLGWKVVKIEQLAANKKNALAMGPFGSRITRDNFVDTGVPVIRGTNLSSGRFDHSNFVFVTNEKANELAASNAFPYDLVFTHRGTLGQVGIIPQGYYPRYIVSQSQMKLTCDQTKVFPMFLYYYFCSPSGQHELLSHTGGSGVPAISSPLTTLKNVTVYLPPLPIQHKIASILSAYDDLIENNTRRITILEQMARMLYEEWFVKFRFPGREQVKMVMSELGMIPEEWEVRSIGDTIEILGGGTPSTKNREFWDQGDIIWYSPTDLTSAGTMFVMDSAKKITNLGLQSSSARLFPAYSVMMTSRATIGVVAINTQLACTNQGFITCIPNQRLSTYQVYHWLLDNKEKIISLASGTTFKEINKTTFRKLSILIPNTKIGERFNNVVISLYKQVENLVRKNAHLRRTRDLLLPKLISGEIDVSSWVESELEAEEPLAVVARDLAVVRERVPITPIDVGSMEQRSLWD